MSQHVSRLQKIIEQAATIKMTTMILFHALVLVVLFAVDSGAWVNNNNAIVGNTRRLPQSTTTSLGAALTERQLQFWEDVEDGLDDIEAFYAKKGENIDRIRQFGRR